MFLADVKLAFPFRLAMPQGSFLVVRGERTYSVTATSGLARRVFHYGTPPSNGESIHLKAAFSKHGQSLDNREVVFTDNPQHFLAECTDHLGYTFLDVRFEIDEPHPEGDQARLEQIEEEAFLAGRYFIDLYREVSNESDVFHPSVEDTPGIEIFIASDYSFGPEGVEGHFSRVSRNIRWQLQHVTGRTKDELPDQKVEALVARLQSGEELPLHVELLLDARDYSVVHRNHRLSLVAVGAAFEVFVQNRVLDECELRGVVQLPVKKDGSATKSAIDAVESGSLVAHLLTIQVRHLCGHSVRSGAEYQNWYSEAYEPRNAVVHAGVREVSEAQAQSAFEVTVAYMNYLDGALAAARP